MKEHSTKVMPPMPTTIADATGYSRYSGAIFTSRKTPALTMVDECSRALVGVGATMAPSSQRWKGICAALVRPAMDSSMSGMTSWADWAPPATSTMPLMDSGTPTTCM